MNTNEQPRPLDHIRGEKSYKEILYKGKWTRRNTKDKGLLDRCLVGSFIGDEDAPTRNDVRRWAQQAWNGAQGVQIYDMDESRFLFEFSSRAATKHVLMGTGRDKADT